MDQPIQQALRSAEEAAARLIECCRQSGSLPPGQPRAVAQVSRTARWLLHAVAALRRQSSTFGDNATRQS